MADFRLAYTVNTSKPLFDLVWVPRQVVVNHEMPTLKVHTFTSCIVGDKDKHLLILHESLDDLAPLLTGHTAVDDIDSLWLSEPCSNLFKQVVQRVLRLSEDDQLTAIAVRIDHQLIIKNAIKLRPFRILTRPQDVKGHAFQALESLHLEFQLLNRLGRGCSC